MKTTVEIPDTTLRQAENLAAAQGIPLTQLFAEALEEKLRKSALPAGARDTRWMDGFGALADLVPENQRIGALIDEVFERIEPEDR